MRLAGLTLVCDLQLLQHGANVHYVTNLPEASTALHEAVQRSHDGMVELLLRYGANAFLENGRGTAWASPSPDLSKPTMYTGLRKKAGGAGITHNCGRLCRRLQCLQICRGS